MTLGDRIVLLDHGVIQQVDTPMNIYQRPANQFVASFIGSPAMNFIRGQLTSGRFIIERAADFMPVDASTLKLDSSLPDGPAVLGVRPEDLIAHGNGQGAPLGTVTLDVVEHMGHGTIAHFALAGSDHVARLAADARVVPGDRVPLAIRPGAWHLFSAADGRRLN
jgi:multiple sugar transport system ATP-binding protein